VRDPDGQLVAAAHMSIVQAAVPSNELPAAVEMLRNAASDIELELRKKVSEEISEDRTTRGRDLPWRNSTPK
jgi:transcriptional regulator of acetoin/glycerol metabolism